MEESQTYLFYHMQLTYWSIRAKNLPRFRSRVRLMYEQSSKTCDQPGQFSQKVTSRVVLFLQLKQFDQDQGRPLRNKHICHSRKFDISSLYLDELLQKYLFYFSGCYNFDVFWNLVRNSKVYSTKGRRNVMGRRLLLANCHQVIQRLQRS